MAKNKFREQMHYLRLSFGFAIRYLEFCWNIYIYIYKLYIYIIYIYIWKYIYYIFIYNMCVCVYICIIKAFSN